MPPRGNKTNRGGRGGGGGGRGIKGRPGRPPKKTPKQGGGVEVRLTTPPPFVLQFKIRKPRTKTRRVKVIKAKTQNTSYITTTVHALTISDESGDVVPSISPPPRSYLDNGEESSTATSTTTVSAASGRGYAVAAAAAAELEEGTVTTTWDIDLPMLSQIVIPGPIPDLGSLYWDDSIFANFFNDIP